MKFVTRPPIETNGVGHGGDDLDEALFAFFRSEMPQSWPPLNLPDGPPRARPAQPAPAPSRRAWFRSPRFALAASVALLIGGAALMSAVLTPPTEKAGVTANDINHGGANLKPQKDDVRGEDAPDDDVDFHGWLEQDGNKPTTIHIEVFKNK
jgi:hypothetical protein